jgi:hypothetical protein
MPTPDTEAGQLGHRRRDVRVRREHAAEADHADEQRHPHLRAGQGAQFTADVDIAADRLRRDPEVHGDQGEQTESADQQERQLPAELLTDQGGRRDADDVGDRQTDHDHRDGPRPPVRRHQRGADHRADPEERAVREPGQETSRHQEFVAGGNGRQHVAEHEHGHQPKQQPLPPGPRPQCRDHRRTDHDADRVRRDDVPRGRDGDVHPVGDLRQQPHRHELGGPDRESTRRQRQQRKPDVPRGYPSVRSHRSRHT